MTWAEWNLKWCHEIDSTMERAHMALKEAGIVQAQLALFPNFSGCGHDHLAVGWDHNGPIVSREDMEKAARVTWPAEMVEEWCETIGQNEPSIVFGSPFRP